MVKLRIVTLSCKRKITYIGVVGNPMANFSRNLHYNGKEKEGGEEEARIVFSTSLEDLRIVRRFLFAPFFSKGDRPYFFCVRKDYKERNWVWRGRLLS